MSLSIAWHKDYEELSFTPPTLRDIWIKARKIFINRYLPILMSQIPTQIMSVNYYPEEVLLLAHEESYVNFVKEMSERGRGLLDYGDTPAFPGVYEKALLAVSGTLTLAEFLRLNRGVGFNPQGGFHHARKASAGGFCVFNDLAIAARYLLRRGVKKLAIIDIDAHHGDGTQDILYRDRVLKISSHGYGYGFYPGTGWIDELGEGEGSCRNINIPMPFPSGDDVYELVLKFIGEILERYNPEFIIVQAGCDAYLNDPLVGLRLTDNSYYAFSLLLSNYASKGVPVLLTGGGGYQPEIVSRLWALMLSCTTGKCLDKLGPLDQKTTSDLKLVKIMESRIEYLRKETSKCL
ncbi:MAG: acetoin utilization protein AcuC [Thermofilum sp.]|jgi:acetoin utilization protein AcuC|nr:acetoin utilization protein AcuC [Thermofilum sp.]